MPDLKPELSQRSKYWIPKHRYYELKHYCLQYPEWKKKLLELDNVLKARISSEIRGSDISRSSENLAIKRYELSRAMELVEECIRTATDELVLQPYIFKAVTEGIPYVRLQAEYSIPCGPDMYYDAYRRFYWLLSERKGI